MFDPHDGLENGRPPGPLGEDRLLLIAWLLLRETTGMNGASRDPPSAFAGIFRLNEPTRTNLLHKEPYHAFQCSLARLGCQPSTEMEMRRRVVLPQPLVRYKLVSPSLHTLT